jgi:hypothetical protein
LLDLTLGKTNDKVAVALIRPAHTGNRAILSELVADGLFLAPFSAELVDEDDVVGLSDCQLLVVGWECHGSNDIALVILISGAGWELVLSDTIFIEEMNHTVSCSNSHALGAWWPTYGWNLLHAIYGRLQVLLILNLHILSS